MARLSSILGWFNPESLLGPIFQKEVRTAGRRRSTYVLRALYALGLAGITTAAFYVHRSQTGTDSLVQQIVSMQSLAPSLTVVIGWFQFVGLMFAAPVLASGSICDERRARSLDVLMTTPMKAWQIVIGKLTSRIVQLVVLALLAIPVLLAVRVFGGLSAEIVLAMTCVAISTAVLGAALSILFSVRQRRATMAALFAILSLLLLQGGPAIAEGIRVQLLDDYSNTEQYHENILATCSPATFLELTSAVRTGKSVKRVELFKPTASTTRPAALVAPAQKMIDLGPEWVLNTAYNLLLAGVVTLYTIRILRRAMTRVEQREGLLAAAGTGGVEAEAMAEEPLPEGSLPVAAGEEAIERFRKRERMVADNPVLWREVRQPPFGSKLVFRIVSGITVVGLALLYWQAGLENEGLHASLALIGAAAMMFQSVFMTSGPYAGEREARTWEVLLTTPLSPWEILRGKLVGALFGFWFIPTVIFMHLVIGVLAGYVHPVVLVLVPLAYVGPVILLTCTGQLFSLRYHRAVTAGALNLVVAVCLWGLIWIGVAFLPVVFPNIDDPQWYKVIDGAYCLNPVAFVYSVLEAGTRGHGSGRGAAPFKLDLPLHNLGVWKAVLVELGVFGFYVIAAAIALGLARLNFKEWSGRTS